MYCIGFLLLRTTYTFNKLLEWHGCVSVFIHTDDKENLFDEKSTYLSIAQQHLEHDYIQDIEMMRYINGKRNIERWEGRIIGVGNKAALVFGGQGSQFPGMGKRNYDAFSEARSVFVLASDVVGYDVAKMCFESSQEELNKTIYCG